MVPTECVWNSFWMTSLIVERLCEIRYSRQQQKSSANEMRSVTLNSSWSTFQSTGMRDCNPRMRMIPYRLKLH